ncbi:MAG: large subunit ribosomal protein [Patescibacteria group bacterium]|nr:large subunit ribosomal protein [Patescibacteria group bacterium]
MKVILLKDTARLGLRGQVKDVADSYAVNVLIPKGLVVQATPSELAKWKQKEDSTKFKKEIASNTFVQLVDALRKTIVEVSGHKHDEKGQLFAQVKEHEIADAIYKTVKLSIDPKQILIEHPIKHIGEHMITLKQGERHERVSITIVD